MTTKGTIEVRTTPSDQGRGSNEMCIVLPSRRNPLRCHTPQRLAAMMTVTPGHGLRQNATGGCIIMTTKGTIVGSPLPAKRLKSGRLTRL